MQVTKCCCGRRGCVGMSDCAPAPSPPSQFEESPSSRSTSDARDWPQGRELLGLLLVVGCCQRPTSHVATRDHVSMLSPLECDNTRFLRARHDSSTCSSPQKGTVYLILHRETQPCLADSGPNEFVKGPTRQDDIYWHERHV